MMAFLSKQELAAVGFAKLGDNVQVSRHASFYGASRITIGDNSRIDDFCVLSAGDGGITIGAHCHIAVMCSLIGAAQISLGDFSGLSSRVSVYSSSDDYSGATMSNPTVPTAYKAVDTAPVVIGRHALIGSGAVILPGIRIADGAAVGALSLVTKDLDQVAIYSGVPAKQIADRKTDMFELEKEFIIRGH